jgi:hypothetical protein
MPDPMTKGIINYPVDVWCRDSGWAFMSLPPRLAVFGKCYRIGKPSFKFYRVS